MRKTSLGIPVIALIGATRGILGAGIALLLAGRMSPEQRMKAGRILFAIGAATTIPLVATVFRSRRIVSSHSGSEWRRGSLADLE